MVFNLIKKLDFYFIFIKEKDVLIGKFIKYNGDKIIEAL